MKNVLRYGGIVASVILIAFGIGAISRWASTDVRLSATTWLWKRSPGSPDMNPKAIAAEAKEAGLTGVALPTKSVADQADQ